MTSTRPLLLQDLARCAGLAAVSICLGLGSNLLRSPALPLHYSTREARTLQQATSLAVAEAPATPVRYLDVDELLAFPHEAQPLVVDARPQEFFALGHIPDALSLPLDDFRGSYNRLRGKLESEKNRPLIVYCQGGECEDSELLAKALAKMGYKDVRVLHGGWEAWQAKNGK